jgi:multiple sugar transport system ATP-binding protein
VALGRAIVREPQVFLFDEPLSNLDAALRVNTRSEIIKQHKRLGSTMIYVTHDQVEAMTMGTRICVMNAGKVAQIGAPLDVYWEPADTFVARFLGSPPMNLGSAVVAGSEAGHVARGSSLDTPLVRWAPAVLSGLVDQKVTVGVRAEDLHINKAALGAEPFGHVRGRAVAVEPLGAETLLLVEIEPGVEWTARLPRHVPVATDEIVDLYFPANAAFIFDATTGRAIIGEARRDIVQ